MMILTPPGGQKKEAFRLFEDGRYQESLDLCTTLLRSGKDPALEVLAATNLFYTGRHEDAELFFRDLAVRMPDSSHVHSYLARVLEARGDEAAIAEYAEAARLDPANQDALRGYAGYLLSREDYRGALPVLRRLVTLAQRPEDVRSLMRALTATGEAGEAIAVHARFGAGKTPSPEYAAALFASGDFRAAADSAYRAWKETGDPAMLRAYLGALSRYDPDRAPGAYEAQLDGTADCILLSDYLRLLEEMGDPVRALHVTGILLSRCPADPACRLAECEILARTGDPALALAKYESLVKDELASKNDMAQLARVVEAYRQFLTGHLAPAEAERRFLGLVPGDVNVASLLGTARFYRDAGNAAEARSWYYRAYRADFLAGGPEYALFLAETGEDRECEKVMLYILSNTRKGTDLVRVAALILEGRMRSMKRLTGQLVRKLEDRRASLGSDGHELLARAYLNAASSALEEGDYPGCKYACLCGMDVLPAYPEKTRLGEFLGLMRDCKERAVADLPVLGTPAAAIAKHANAAVPAPVPITVAVPGLTAEEEKIVAFLRLHRKATEMDLRRLLGTRRVVGIVNRIVQKAAAAGIGVLEKKGVGDDGEIYEYCGS